MAREEPVLAGPSIDPYDPATWYAAPKGSIFDTLHWRRAEGEEVHGYEEARGRTPPEQMANQHVYVINGSSDFLDIVRELLQDEHYNVTTTNFVPLSFETVEAAQPSLLIIDLVLGERAGWDLLGRLRQSASTCTIPVLLVSTTAGLLDEARARHDTFGGDRYLIKPFDLDELLAIVHDMIDVA